MQWNTSVRAEPRTAQHSFPANKHAGPCAAWLMCSSGSALQSWVAEVYEEHLLSRMNAEVTLSEEVIAERYRLLFHAARLCSSHSQHAQLHCGAEQSGAALGEGTMAQSTQ